jgi:amino acid adenylation domain-containing protein/FkbH-like protein
MSRLEGYALSPQQKAAWLDIVAGNSGYVQAVFRLNNAPDWKKLCAAANTVLDANQVYRLKFIPVPGSNEPVQVPVEENSVHFELAEAGSEQQAREMILAGSSSVAWEEALLKVVLYHSADNSFNQLVFSSSPLCADVWSIHLLALNVFSVYNNMAMPEEPPIDYLQFAEWQNQLLVGDELQEGKAYWQSKLSAVVPAPEVIFSKKHNLQKPGVLFYEGSIDAIEHQSVESLLGAGWYALLWKLNRDTDFQSGHVHHGRSYEQLYHVVGNFAKLLPLQLELKSTTTLAGVIQQYTDELNLADTHKEALEVKEQYHQFVSNNLPFRFEYIDLDVLEDKLQMPARFLQPERKMKLHLLVIKRGGSYHAQLYYDSASYNNIDVAYLFNAWKYVVQQAVSNADTTIADLSFGTDFTSFIVSEQREYEDADVIELFNQHLADNIAVTDETGSLTYEELDKRSSSLAKYLVGKGYMTGHKRIGIVQAEKAELIISMLAVLKAGGTYVPIDANDSEKRLQHIVTDSGIAAVLTTAALQAVISNDNIAVVALDQIDFVQSSFDNIALPARSSQTPTYIIYTSGTSGLPKGVVITDASLVNYIKWLQQFASISNKDSAVLLSSYAFDLGYTALWGMLLSGGSLHLVSRDRIQDMDFLIDYIAANNISFLKTTPSFFNVLVRSVNANRLKHSNLRLFMLGGEIINADDLLYMHTQINSRIAFINHYGPTETTIGTIAHKIDIGGLQDYKQHPVIGKPITNNKIFILDNNDALAAPGLVGEICIGGKGLATGYLNRPELTAEKFIVHPSAGERIYRTGDTGSWMPDGTILYLGRKDDQVKIRGYRVEPGEVKLAVSQYPGIEQVVIAVKGDAYDKQLIAYVTGNLQLDTDNIKTFLKQAVPDYMIPGHIVQLKEIPLTANHKVDFKSLPEPGSNTVKVIVQPRNSREEQVIKVWRTVLANEHIGIDDDFFDLGGHSLKAIQVVNRLQKELKLKATIRDIFNFPTVRSFCEATMDANEPVVQSIEAAPVAEHYALSHSQKRYWLTSQRKASRALSNVPQCCVFKGKLNVDLLQDAFVQLILRHESLRTIFKVAGGEPVQVILPADKVVFYLQQLVASGKEEVAAIINEEIITPFDLENNIAIRAKLVTIATDEYLLLFTLHHIISDGWSREIIYRELMHFYEANYHGRAVALSPLRIQYKDYVNWHNNIYKQQEPFWTNFFQHGVPDNSFPLDNKRPELLTFEGDVFTRGIDGELLTKLRQLVSQNKLTLNSLLLGSYGLLLAAYGLTKEVIIGTLVSGRNHLDLEGIVGVFINFLPFKMNAGKENDFIGFIKTVNKDLIQLYQHQDYPFDLMVDKFIDNTTPARNPVFDTMMIFHEEENNILLQELPGGVKIEAYEGFTREYLSKLDFKVDVTTNETGVSLRLEYNRNLFRPETMQLFLDRYVALLAQAVEQPAAVVNQLPVVEETMQSMQAAAKVKPVKVKDTLKIISSFTAEPLQDHLTWWLEQFDQPCNISFGPYHQVFQQLLSVGQNKSSGGEICVLLNRFEDYVKDWSGNDTVDTLNMVYGKMEQLVTEAAASVPVIMLITPPSDAINEHSAIINQLNEKCYQSFKEKDNVYVIDLRNYRNMHPGLELFDEVSYKQAFIPFTDEGFYFIAYHINRLYWALKGNASKVIALDCDNTIWEGIVGEDNLEGIHMREGHRALQQYFIQKYHEGFLLTLVSKNNEKDVWHVFENHPGMLLKKEHFVAWRINWDPKTQNIRSLAKELNLGLDSFAFIDDNPVECFQMMQENPEVLTLELPQDHQHIAAFLDQVISFDKLKVSREDVSRNEMYKAEVKRNELLQDVELSAFLEHLGLEMSFRLMQAGELERVAQLTMRTNQFNMNGVRRSKQEILQLTEEGEHKCYVVHVRDRFGDYGLVGVVILSINNNSLLLHNFLLSCRVLGRGIEEAVLNVLHRIAGEQNANDVAAAFSQTAKNVPFSEFLERTAWAKDDEGLYHSSSAPVVTSIKIYFNEDLPQKSIVAEVVKEQLLVPRIDSYSPAANTNAWIWKRNLVNEEKLWHKNVYKALEFANLHYLRQMKQQQLLSIVSDEGEMPQDELTATVLRLFREVLKNGRIKLNDDFFRMGGHSIKAVQLLSNVYKTFGVNISLADFFEMGTAQRLAEEIAKQQSLEDWLQTTIAEGDKSFEEIII